MFESLKKKLSDFVSSFKKKEEGEIKESSIEKSKEETVEKKGEESKEEKVEKKEEVVKKKAEDEEVQKIKADITATTKIKGLLFKKVKIKEEDIDDMLEQLKLSLIEADVNYDVAEKFIEKLRGLLVGREVDSKNIEKEINAVIREALLQTLSKSSNIDIVSFVKEKRGIDANEPVKILFLGPNGAGKTTTIAKIAKMLKDAGLSCVLSASDTFRAAAIEQLAMHAEKLGVPIIKGTYGADPASIAFDAIAYSRAHHIDAVLIDTAGRQETNKSLLEEMKKIVRVAKPDLKIFVGESIAGNALLEQVKEFNEAIGLNGIILTKLDCDAKGGNTLSILSETDIPIIYFGTGESYEKLVKYNPNEIIENIVS
ncbi:MAG: signal recognition particle-docking protein FtsY [Candidatus Micrarchaeota archaeon]